MTIRTLVDGAPATSIPLDDRGLQYGDGLFETCALSHRRIELRQRHLQRLALGCRRLGLPVPDNGHLGNELDALIDGVSEGLVKIILTRGSGGRGYRAPERPAPRRILSLYPPVTPAVRFAAEGVRLYPCRTRLGTTPVLAGIKHLNRLEQVLARAEWDDPTIAEGLVCDQQARPVEGTMSNLFVVRGGALLTPDLSRCGVAGVMRELVLELAHADATIAHVEVRDLDPEEVAGADELFITNSVIRLWPVVGVGKRRYRVGPVTRRLQQAVGDALDR